MYFFLKTYKQLTWMQMKYQKFDFINYKKIGNYP